jgi:hypothetical protein
MNTTLIFGVGIDTQPSGSLLKRNIITRLLTPFDNLKALVSYYNDSRFYCSVIQIKSKQ